MQKRELKFFSVLKLEDAKLGFDIKNVQVVMFDRNNEFFLFYRLILINSFLRIKYMIAWLRKICFKLSKTILWQKVCVFVVGQTQNNLSASKMVIYNVFQYKCTTNKANLDSLKPQVTHKAPTSKLFAHVLQLFRKEGVAKQQARLPHRAPTSHSLQISVPDSLTLVRRTRGGRESVTLEERPFN